MSGKEDNYGPRVFLSEISISTLFTEFFLLGLELLLSEARKTLVDTKEEDSFQQLEPTP